MQPLNTTPRPRSLSFIGCCEEGARSRMLRRRCPNPSGPCAKKPAASGPRERIELAAFETSTSEASPLVLTSPQIPHMPVVELRCRFIARELQPFVIAVVPLLFQLQRRAEMERSLQIVTRVRSAH